MAKKKSAPKKKAVRSVKGQGNKSIVSFLYLPMLVVLVAIGAAAYGLVSTQLKPANEQHREELVGVLTEQYESYFNNALALHEELMDRIAASPDVVDLIESGSRAAMDAAELRIKNQVPQALSVHLFPVRAATMQNDTNPPLSHAGLDMILSAERALVVPIEAHNFQGTTYLQSVRAVRNDNDRVIGTISIAQTLEYLSHQLSGIDSESGHLLVKQQFEGGAVQTLVTYGVQNSNPVANLRSDNPNWTLTFQPSDEITSSTIFNINIFWAVFAVLALVCVAPLFLTSQRLQLTLRHDANAFAKQVQALLMGQPSANLNYEFAIFSTLAKTVNRMRMGKSQGSERGVASQLDGGLARATMAETNSNFDVAMMDADSDLLGMSQAESSQQLMTVDESIFRAYDIRGIVGQTLTSDTALQIGLAIGSEAYERGEQTIIVGRDGRLSSPEMTKALIRGLAASGRDVIDIGMVPTPLCYFACEHLGIGACVMVTGSHNAPNYNGFKVVLGKNALIEDEIKGLYHRIENQNFLSGTGNATTEDIASAYLTRISDDVKAKRPLKVVIDCGNAVAGNFAPQLIKGVGCHVLPLYCDIDGNFPNHQPDPSDPKNMADLCRTVVETRADLGLAFDGDGDRIGIVTNSGKIIYADRLLMLLAKQVVQANPGSTVLYDVKSSRRLKTLIAGFGGKPMMWKTGHSFMKRKMRETGAALAGEMSGHIFYQDRWYGFDDALYTAARLIEILAGQNETIDTLLNELPQDLATPELAITSTDERKFRIIEALQRNGQFAGGQVTNIDGIRVDFADGWGLVRASNTTPKLSCRFEADNENAMRKIQELFKQQLLAVDSQLQIPF